MALSEESKSFRYELTAKPLELGFMNILKDIAEVFPKGINLIKIKAIFDDSDKEIELTYNPKRRRLYGLTGWYRRHNAQVGDIIIIEPIESFKKYRFRFEKIKGLVRPLIKKPLKKKGKERSIVGEAINFRGLVYAPVNEQGTVFLFGKVIEDLNMYLEEIRTAFPDAVGRRFDGKGWIRENIEFEFKSSDYKTHGHPIEGCDIVICWEHDWKECPIEVIELKSLIRELPKERK
ncbi:MAG: hypothetical protein H3Z52_03630 [archaeon]|nr:hypothetical protein [archaeon]